MASPDIDIAARNSALAQAAAENGLAAYYIDCVKPLLNMPVSRWPRCCGSQCEPCSEVLKRTAARTLELLGRVANVE